MRKPKKSQYVIQDDAVEDFSNYKVIKLHRGQNCSVKGCKQYCPSTRFFCYPHYKKLTPWQKSKLSSYSKYSTRCESFSTLLRECIERLSGS